MKPLHSLLLMTALMPMAGCAFSDKPIPCPVCYEDEWSREPFPGEAKQHIKPLTPEELKANGGLAPRAPSATTY